MTAPFELRDGEASGAPLLFLHGFMGRPSMWDATLAELRGRSAIAPRPVALGVLPGHGPAPWLPEGEGFFAAVDALARALPSTRPAWLVGYSMGARVGLALALRHPARVAGAVLVGVDPGLRDEAARAERAAWDDAQALRIEAEGVAAFAASWAALPLFATQAALPGPLRAAQDAARREHTAAGLAWAMRALGLGRMPPQWDTLRRAPPLHLVTGARDEKFAALAREIARVAPGSTHRAIEGAGHNVALEAPGALAAEIAARAG
jgi:2-succinyl-6-hydroxy-2,4-cyclohexadiene-1-carboxylate synthase